MGRIEYTRSTNTNKPMIYALDGQQKWKEMEMDCRSSNITFSTVRLKHFRTNQLTGWKT